MIAPVCRSCGAAITWAMTPRGRRVPLDPSPCSPTDAGALVVVELAVSAERWAYGLRDLAERVAAKEGVSYDRALDSVSARYPAYRSHFSTCPNAKQHRRKGAGR